MSLIADIEAAWFGQGTAADVAIVMNARDLIARKITGAQVRQVWAHAHKEGRLPPFQRPSNGFPPGPADILRRFALVAQGRAA